MAVALHCETIGSGSPVLVLHGLFGAARNWLTIARRLADAHTFHLVDLRNHGRSPHTDSMTYGDMIEDVRALVDALGLHCFTLVGHSMGGKVAMTMALNDAAGISKLIAIDIAPVSYPDRFVEMIAAMLALELTLVHRRSDADVALSAAIPDHAVRQFILQNLLFEDGAARWRANLPTLKAQMPHILGPLPIADDARFNGPTWFVRGERSDRVTSAEIPIIARLFGDYRIETVAGAGHWPHADAPGAFMEIFACALAA